jgi:hypothetical protein
MEIQPVDGAPPGARNPGLLPWLFLVAAAVAGVVGILSVASGACPTCTGLLSVVLPWTGMLFYLGLGVLAWRRPAAPGLVHLMGLFVFIHACLVLEAIQLRQYCVGCMVVAALALAAGGLMARRFPSARTTLMLSLVLGAAAGYLLPFDRLDDTLTRRFWPSKILSRAPAFVDRSELAACEHSAHVRFIAYEDERTCLSCSSVSRRLIPGLAEDFPEEVCVHKHALRTLPPGQVLPVLVLMSRDMRLVVIEGLPSYEELRDLVRSMLPKGGAHPAHH